MLVIQQSTRVRHPADAPSKAEGKNATRNLDYEGFCFDRGDVCVVRLGCYSEVPKEGEEVRLGEDGDQGEYLVAGVFLRAEASTREEARPRVLLLLVDPNAYPEYAA